jgi:phosphate transport system substrate-binding protein
MKRLLTALVAGLSVTACASQTTGSTLNAAGATFPAPLYLAWGRSYNEVSGNQINYQSVGSGAGVRQYTANTIDFGASDAAISDEKLPEQGVVQIPTTGGAIAVVYNESSCPSDLMLTQENLADVYMGHIDNWSELGCGDRTIVPVFRSDGSGTTKGFTASLSAFSPRWADEVGSGKAVEWPVGIGAKGNSGVAAQLQNVPGTIGYVNYGYVAQIASVTSVAAIENANGQFILPSPTSASIGLAGIELDDQLRGSDPNPKGIGAYPIVSYTWILAYPEHRNNETTKDFLRYIMSDDAQNMSEDLGYVPLPYETRVAALERIEQMK